MPKGNFGAPTFFPLAPDATDAPVGAVFICPRYIAPLGTPIMTDDPWKERSFTQDEAADIAGFKPAALRKYVHRLEGAEVLFSELRHGRRWYSPMDIAVLATGRDLVDGGMQTITAVAVAFEHLQSPPDLDIILTVPNGAYAVSQARVFPETEVAHLALDKSIQLIPLGKIAARVQAECSKQYRKSA